MSEYKRCPRCGETKYWTEFYLQKSGWLSAYCKPCTGQYGTAWGRAHPDQKHQQNARNYNSEYHTEYRKNHEEQRRAYDTGYRREHPGWGAANQRRYRARKVGGGGTHTVAEWEDLKRHYDYRCLCCGRDDIVLEADHILPISKGGSDDISNIQPLCRSCNRHKSNKYTDYREFYP